MAPFQNGVVFLLPRDQPSVLRLILCLLGFWKLLTDQLCTSFHLHRIPFPLRLRRAGKSGRWRCPPPPPFLDKPEASVAPSRGLSGCFSALR